MQVQLETMDLAQLEALAAEAAQLQQRAALAMKFARQRMGPPSDLLPLHPAAAAASAGPEAAPAPVLADVGTPRSQLPRMALLVAVVCELSLLVGLGAVFAAAAQARRGALAVASAMALAPSAMVRWVLQLWALLLGSLLAVGGRQAG
jgi:hypothetical protein